MLLSLRLFDDFLFRAHGLWQAALGQVYLVGFLVQLRYPMSFGLSE